MKQLLALSEYLVGLDIFDANDFDSWVDNPNMETSGKDLGNGGIVVCWHSYDAVFYIAKYLHKKHSAQTLYAHVATWLMQNDTERWDQKNAAIGFDVQIIDRFAVEITITIDFAESIEAVQDDNGPIYYDGKFWRVDDAETLIAEYGFIDYAGD